MEKSLQNLSQKSSAVSDSKPRLLVSELWGIGDIAIAAPFLKAASEKYRVSLLAKSYANELRPYFFSDVNVIPLNAPWTRFRGKYDFWNWNWREMFAVSKNIRAQKFDLAASARPDPRDHLLFFLLGIKRRIGFSRAGSKLFLTHALNSPNSKHRYNHWRELARELGFQLPEIAMRSTATGEKTILIHTGAAQSVRVWPLERYATVIQRLRELGFVVQIASDASQENWWTARGENVVVPKTIPDLMALMQNAVLFIGNDSGPGHIAAISGVPTFTIFGPQLPELFLPIHPKAQFVEGKPCRYKPCSDYCRFPEPFCISTLEVTEVWARLHPFVEEICRQNFETFHE